MNESRLNTVAQLRAFLEGTLEVEFCPLSEDSQRYAFISALLKRFGYPRLGRADKGVVLRYLQRTTGYSRQQLTRLVRRAADGAPLVKRYRAPAHPFVRKFSPADVALLAETDALHGTLSGPATVHLLRRAYARYGDSALPAPGRRCRCRTCTTCVPQRRLPGQAPALDQDQGRGPAHRRATRAHPQGRPGFIRIDSVHQGDLDGLKGVYHINAVDCLTQFELVASCERISEAYLLPVLQALLEDFPFTHPGVSRRQRLGVHQPHRGQAARQAARGAIHQVTPRAQQRQRPGRDQERGHRAQAPGLCPHRPALRPRGQCVLPRASEPLRELPPPLLLPRDPHRCQGQGAQALPLRGHDDPLREAQVAARRRGLPQSRA